MFNAYDLESEAYCMKRKSRGVKKRKQARTYFKYASNWKRTCDRTRKIFNRCTLNPLHKAECIHHLQYRRSIPRIVLGWLCGHKFNRSVAGWEIPGWDVVPLCKRCHGGRTRRRGSVHSSSNWHSYDNQYRNHQKFLLKWKLRCLFWLWALWWLWCLSIAIAGWLLLSVESFPGNSNKNDNGNRVSASPVALIHFSDE